MRRVTLGLITCFCLTLLLLPLSANAQSPSHNVVIIGASYLDPSNPCTGYGGANDNDYAGSGCFPVTGPDLSPYSFAAMLPANVTLAALQPYDTVFLNVAAVSMGCSMNALSTQAKADLFTFVRTGHKLIIYDGECYTQNYSWLNDLSFVTNNPGAMGATGTLNIVEDSALATAKAYRNCSIPAADPNYTFLQTYCVNVDNLSSATDAVGDANVMVTYSPWWKVNMTARNTNNVQGPVHTYALLGQDQTGAVVYGADQGIVIYNGQDFDYLGYGYNNANLRKIWVQELGLPFNPSNLQGTVSVIGINLSPLNADKFVGASVIFTATLTDLLGTPKPNIQVDFSTRTGPNSGQGITCNPLSCQTDTSGNVTATYSGPLAGTDTLKACFTNTSGTYCAGPASVNWKLVCDANNDGMVNSTDISLIQAARNTPATLGFDVRDIDGDRMITLRDARLCVFKCTTAGCQ